MQKIHYIHKLDGTMRYAHACPYCQKEGGSLESQEISLSDDKKRIVIRNAWECVYCYETWYQEIEAELGQVLKNEVEG